MDNQPLSPEPLSDTISQATNANPEITPNLSADTAALDGDIPQEQLFMPAITDVGLWWRWFLMTLFGVLLGTITGIPACLAGLYWWGEVLIEHQLCQPIFGGSTHLGCGIATAMLSGSVVMGLWLGLCQSWILPRILGHQILGRKYRARSLFPEEMLPYPRQRPYRRWWVLASVIGWTCIGLTATSLAYLPVLTAIIAPEGPSIDPSISQQLPSLTTGWGWLIGSGILLGMLQWLVLVFATWRNSTSGRSPWRRAVVWRSAWWVFLHSVLFGLTGLAIIVIFRGRGGLFALLIFFLGFMPFYAAITGANLVKLKLDRSIKHIKS
ncbi:MAG: hypothetical protein WCO45_07225 [Pseudanabaena sp. ELA607]